MRSASGEARLPAGLVGRLRGAGLDPGYVQRVAARALDEDLGEGEFGDGIHAGGRDLTSAATIPPGTQGRAEVVARADGVVAGLPVAEALFWLAGLRDRGLDAVPGPGGGAGPFVIKYHAADGDRVKRGDVLLTVTGPVRTLLTAERTALNLLTHLSGVATLTRRWADEVAGTGARIRDTRKTLPGLRALQKYAVRCGGGQNHRMSLSDAVLIKDNHVAAAGSIGAAVAAVEPYITDEAARLTAEVECDTLDQVREAAAAGARLILLDNFAVADMAAAVELVAGLRPRPRLEASGGLTLGRARDVAATGVDYLSVGALTHSAPGLDIALDLLTTESPRERHAADD